MDEDRGVPRLPNPRLLAALFSLAVGTVFFRVNYMPQEPRILAPAT